MTRVPELFGRRKEDYRNSQERRQEHAQKCSKTSSKPHRRLKLYNIPSTCVQMVRTGRMTSLTIRQVRSLVREAFLRDQSVKELRVYQQVSVSKSTVCRNFVNLGSIEHKKRRSSLHDCTNYFRVFGVEHRPFEDQR